MKTAFVFLTLLILSVLSVEAGKKNKKCCKENKAKIAALEKEMSDQKKQLTQQKADIEALKMTVENLAELVNATCPCKPPPPSQASSCQELYEKDPSIKSGMYKLLVNSQETVVYCHMGIDECGNGGWTTAMKIDGKKRTFHYDSDYWSNKQSFNDAGGETGFDEIETKLPTYWSTPFSKICLGMKVNGQDRFIVINKQSSSLYSLIADGQHRATSLSRDMWNSLIGEQASMQVNCNRQGFNAKVESNPGGPRARVGYIANNENNCDTNDSRIGFGTGGAHDDSNTCGNEAKYGGDNGDKHIKAMGYILVQ